MAYQKIDKPRKRITVNGKRYGSHYGGIIQLSDAKKEADKVRKMGYYAQIREFEGSGNAKGKKGYMVYVRKK